MTNVLRDSERAVPQTVGKDGISSQTSDPVAGVDKTTKDEPRGTTQPDATPSEPKGESESSKGTDKS